MGQHRSWLIFSLPLLLLSFMGLWWNIPVPQNYQIVYFSFVLVIFNIIYFAALAPMVSSLGQAAVSEAGVTGVEGWFFSSLNFVIIAFDLIAFFVIARVGL
jgi:Na+/melibiose symporter-like transporter